MNKVVRFGTARKVWLGPAIATGGLTAVTTLLASNVTALRLYKNSATLSVTATGRTFTHVLGGHYVLSLLSGDVNTYGHLRVGVRATGTVKALQFWEDFFVVPTNVYDSHASGASKQNVGTLASAAVVWTAAGRVLSSGLVVWSVAARTLTSGGVNWTAAARTLTSAGVVWTAAARGLTSKVGFALTSAQHDAIGARAWAQTTRTLTSGGTVWTAGTRVLTSAAVVWSAAARGLTSKIGFALTSAQHDTIGSRTWAQTVKVLSSAGVVWSGGIRTLSVTGRGQIWSYATRTLTAAAGGSSASTIWAYTARTLTSGGAAKTSVWGATARTLTSGGSVWDANTNNHVGASTVGEMLQAAAAGDITAGNVWSFGARSLTDKTGFALTSAQHDAIGVRVWGSSVRTLTSAAVVWTAAARGLTSKVGFGLTSAQHDTTAVRVWANTARTLTSGGNVASSVWGRGLAEVTGAPGGLVAAGTKLSYIYVGTRFKRVTSATGDKLYNSASVVIAKAPISRSSIVFTRGKFVAATA